MNSTMFLFTFLMVTVFLMNAWLASVAIQQLPPSKLKFQFYLREDKERLMVAIHTNPNGSGQMIDCYLYGDRTIIETFILNVSNNELIVVNEPKMKFLEDHCTKAKLDGSLPQATYLDETLRLGFIKRLFIFPGTKWCGPGNISSSYDDLGSSVETDKCCREHDHCPDNIPAFGSSHGLRNDSPVTKSNCECDEKFYSCLQEANTSSSNQIGKIFFNILQMNCFRMDYPVIKCLECKGILPIHQSCQKYEFNTEEDPMWQFFDAKYYEAYGAEISKSSGNEITEDSFLGRYRSFCQSVKYSSEV